MTANKKIPALRFKEFEGEWNNKKLGEIFTITAGGDIQKENVSELRTNKFKYPIYANAEKEKGFYGYSDVYKFEEGTLTIAGRGVNIGIAHARYHRFYPIVRLLVLIPINEESNVFFEYAINNLNILSESTGVPQLTVPQVSNYKVSFPKKEEQQKIASFFTSVDDKIQQLTKKKALLEQYKKGVMQQIFNQQIRFKDDDGKDYPDWDEKELGSIFSFIPTNSFSRSQLNYTKGSVQTIHYGDIHTKYKPNFDITKELVPFLNEDIDVDKIPEENYCKQGDLIVADASEDYNDIGKAIEIINLENKKLTAGLHTYILRDNSNVTATGFKSYLMKSYGVRVQMMKMATGISVLGITKGNLSKVKIHLPVKEEQQKIADFLTGIDKKIDLVNQQLEKTKEFKKGLLQAMFV